MTDKHIIIDGVDISKCKHYDEVFNYCDQSYLGEGGLLKNTKNPKRCDYSPNCYYKQLKRKEQELQEAMDNYVQLDLQRVKEYNELVDLYKAKEQECEKLKKELEVIYDDCKGCPTCNEALYNANLYAREYRKFKQALTEIKGIAEENIRIADLEGLNGVYRRGLAEQILQKISEVLDD